jgi:hypothetical protein
MVMSIAPVKYPTELQNQSNGDIDPSLLKLIGTNTYMLKVAADWYAVLQKEFQKANGRPLSFTFGGGYRTWKQQYNLFVSRYEKVSYATYLVTPSTRRKVWPAEVGPNRPLNPSKSYWRKKVIGTLPNGTNRYPATAAVPGTSNHGWGLACDLAIGVPEHATGLTGTDRTWLENNIARFGFSYESTSEPWHVRYVMGDVCPPFINERH